MVKVPGVKMPSKDFMKKAAMIGTGNVFGQAIAFAFLTLLARWMTKSDYGEVRYVISVSALFATVVAMGLPTAMTRFLAKYRDDSEKRDIYFTNIIAIFLVMLALTEIVVAIIFHNRLIFVAVVLGYSIPLLYMGVVRGLMQYKKFSWALVTRNLIKFTVLIILFYTAFISVTSVLLTYAFAGWLGILILESIWPSRIHTVWSRVSGDIIKDILKFAIPVMATTIAYSVITTVQVIVLEWQMDYAAVAVYSTAFTLTLVYGFVPTAILTMIMPKIAAIKSLEKRMEVFTQSVKLIAIAGIVLWLGTVVFGKWILVLLFTEKYAVSYWPLVVLSIGSIFAGIRNAFSALWEGGGKPIYSTYDTIGGGIAGIAAALVFIPLYGPVGAAAGYTCGWIASVSVSTYFWTMLKKGKIELK